MTAARLPIVQYWHSGSPPDYVAGLIETFKSGNPDLRHMLFDRPSAETLIAEHFTPREVAAFRSCAVPAMQSDYFRYCAILAMGGIYCDIGYRCKAPLRTILEGCDGASGRLFQHPAGDVINGLFGFESPGHPFLELAVEIATRNIETRSANTVWEITGAPIFTVLWELGGSRSIEALGPEAQGAKRRKMLATTQQSLAAAAANRDVPRAAFEGIEVTLLTEVGCWIDRPGVDLRYKQSDTHWLGYESSIYRDHREREQS